MTGTGTFLDPYIIEDVNDLQAMQDDLTAYYELGGDIDASATIGWNAGAGFLPIGGRGGAWTIYAQSDIGESGTWTQFPAFPASKYDKLLDGNIRGYGWPNTDGDDTYVDCSVPGFIQFWITDPLALHPKAIISSLEIIYSAKKAVGDFWAIDIYPEFLIDGTRYNNGHNAVSRNYMWLSKIFNNNPLSGVAWTVDDLTGIGPYHIDGFGLSILDLLVPGNVLRVSTLGFEMVFNVDPFEGHFDGKGYTISDLHINRPSLNYVGLFGVIDGAVTIQSVTLADCEVIGSRCVGALVGGVGDIDAGVVAIDGCQSSGYVEGYDGVGGLIGVDLSIGGGG